MDSQAPRDIYELVTPNDPKDVGHLQVPRNGNLHSAAPSLAHSFQQLHHSPAPMDSTSCTQVHVMNSSKDADDPSLPLEPRRSRRSYATVPTTLSKLFAIQAPLSPASSRATSYNAQMSSQRTHNYGPLPVHLYNRGLIEGKYSDITINAFGTKYQLHRLVLDRSPYFASAFSGPWSESRARDITLYPEDVDGNITKAAFDLALKRLYGCSNVDEEEPEAVGLLAVGSWLDMQDLVEASVDMLIKSMELNNLGPIISLITSNCYGKCTEKLIIAAKAMISREGWDMPLKCWNEIPAHFINQVLSSDGLFVPSEFDRFTLTRRLLDCRLKQLSGQSGRTSQDLRTNMQRLPEEKLGRSSIYDHPEVTPLLSTLDNGIYYIHMDFEQLQCAKLAKDFFGNTVVPRKRITDALWTSVEFRQHIVRAKSKQVELHLTEKAKLANSNPVDGRHSGDFAFEATQKTLPKQSTSSGISSVTSSQPIPKHFERKESIEDERRFWVPEEDMNIVLGGLRDSFTRQIISESAQAESFQSRPPSLLDSLHQLPKPYSHSCSDQTSGVYTRYPPFRFSVEFKDLRNLKENRRIHSRTVWYAGSFWNVYIVRKANQESRNPQIGVYLERKQAHSGNLHLTGTNLDESFGSSKGVVDERIRHLEREMRWLRSHSLYLNSNPQRPQRPHSYRRDSRLSNGYHNSHILDNNDNNSENNLFHPSNDCHNRNQPTSPSLGLSAFIMGSGQYRNSVMSRTNSSHSTRPISALHIDRSPVDTSSSSDEHEHEQSRPHEFSSPPLSSSKKHSRTSETALPLYNDPRPVIKAYFKIISPVNGGRMLNVLESGPDIFSSSRRPGWSNVNLCLQDPLSVDMAAKMSNGNSPEEEADISEGLGLGGDSSSINAAAVAAEASNSSAAAAATRSSSTDTGSGTFWEEEDDDDDDDDGEERRNDGYHHQQEYNKGSSSTTTRFMSGDGALKFMVVIGIV